MDGPARTAQRVFHSAALGVSVDCKITASDGSLIDPLPPPSDSSGSRVLESAIALAAELRSATATASWQQMYRVCADQVPSFAHASNVVLLAFMHAHATCLVCALISCTHALRRCSEAAAARQPGVRSRLTCRCRHGWHCSCTARSSSAYSGSTRRSNGSRRTISSSRLHRASLFLCRSRCRCCGRWSRLARSSTGPQPQPRPSV